MSQQSLILLPVFLQVFLTLAVYLVLGRRRFGAVEKGEAKAKEFLYGGGGPEKAQLAARNVANQFELPVLFYALVAFALITGVVNAVLIALAWAFVISRYVHAFGHIQGIINIRFVGFLTGYGVIFLMWLVFAFMVLF